MGIILSEAAYPGQAVECPTQLVAIDRAILGVAAREIAVGAHVGLVDLDVEGTIHRLGVVGLTFDIHRGVHALFVEVEVP